MGYPTALNLVYAILCRKSRKKLSDRDPGNLDRDYMDAINCGNMKTAQQMVDEAAKQWGAFLNNADANGVFRQNGEVRIFYHGTNTGDMGWFGKGFYFALSSKEAATYGGRVTRMCIKAAENLTTF